LSYVEDGALRAVTERGLLRHALRRLITGALLWTMMRLMLCYARGVILSAIYVTRRYAPRDDTIGARQY